MTRKHFELLARALKDVRPAEHWDANKRTQWTMDVKAIAKIAEAQNTRFKPDVFFAACGGLFNV